MAGAKPTGSDNFAALDGLRGVGALIVVYGHTSGFFWPTLGMPSAAMVVDLFFLLSGFVIAYSYEPKLLSGAMGVRGFMLQRVIRLYPLYFLGIFLGYVVHMLMAAIDPDGFRAIAFSQDFAVNLLGLPFSAAHGLPLFELNGPAWTLFFEISVNLLYALAFRWLRDTRVLAAVVVLFFVALAASVISYGRIDIGNYWGTWWVGYERAGFGFFAGVLAYRLVGSPRTAKRPYSPLWVVVVFLVPLVGFIPASRELRPFVDLGLVLLAGVPLLWLGATVAPPSRVLRLCLLGGRLSYGIYILHYPFVVVLQRLAWRNPEVYKWPPLPGILLAIVAVTVAFLAEKYYDRPVRRFIAAKLRERSNRKANAQGSRPMASAD
ncbi:MAG TPA: acyltransferase [Hyphomonadaceae bacterium]|nr:acyltransferase [Hyphomonadaceae bacterium]